MMSLVPPDPDFVRLKRRLKRSRDNIRQTRSDFFSSPVSTRTPTPNELWQRRDMHNETLWENEPQPGGRLSVPSIYVTNNSGSPMSTSDRDDDELDQTSSSLSLRYFSEDEGVELRRPSSYNAYNVPVVRSQSFQEQATFSIEDASPDSVKRVLSDDVITPTTHSQRCTATARDKHELPIKPHVMTRLIAKMRRATLDWRRANRSRRGELPACVFAS